MHLIFVCGVCHLTFGCSFVWTFIGCGGITSLHQINSMDLYRDCEAEFASMDQGKVIVSINFSFFLAFDPQFIFFLCAIALRMALWRENMWCGLARPVWRFASASRHWLFYLRLTLSMRHCWPTPSACPIQHFRGPSNHCLYWVTPAPRARGQNTKKWCNFLM